MNLNTCDWDESILKEFSIKKDILAEIRPCDASFGFLNIEGLEHIEITGVMGD